MRRVMTFAILVAALAVASPAMGQQQRPLSPAGSASAMVGGEWVKNDRGNLVYQGGRWIEVTYSRPMLRQRENIFGAGAEYGQGVMAGSPVWRLGADQTTRFKTEVPLMFGDKKLPAGEYSMFVDLKEGAWTLIFSNWPAQEKYDPENKEALWGSYGYTPEKDVIRVPMNHTSNNVSIDQLTLLFANVTKDAGTLAILWENTIATARFTVGT